MSSRWTTYLSVGIAAIGGLILLRIQRRSLSTIYRKLKAGEISTISELKSQAKTLKDGEEFVVCGRLATSAAPAVLGLGRNKISPTYRALHSYYGFGLHDPASYSVTVTQPRNFLLQDFLKPDDELFLVGDVAEKLFVVAQQTRQSVSLDAGPLPLRLAKRLLNLLILALNALLRLRLGGFHIGVVEKEYEVAVKTPLYAFVSAQVRKWGAAPLLRPSEFVYSSLADMRTDVAQMLRSNTFFTTALVLLLTGTLWGLARILLMRTARQETRQRAEAELSREQLLLGGEIEGLRCIICENFPKGVVLLPCNHCSMCRLCSYDYLAAKAQPLCPICKVPVEGQAIIEYQ